MVARIEENRLERLICNIKKQFISPIIALTAEARGKGGMTLKQREKRRT